MATASKGFQRRVRDRVTKERPVITFFLETTDEDEEGNEIVVRHDDFTATQPSEEQLLLIFAQGGNEDAGLADEVSAILRFFKDSLPADQYKVLIGRLRDADDPDVDSEVLTDIFSWLMEQWQDFPTRQPAASSGSRGTTGARSTGRVRGKGSTR